MTNPTQSTLKNADLQARKNAATPRGVGVMCDFYAARAENAELWDVEGRRFIDFAAGIAVCNTGHRHPKIVAAIRAQLDRFTHTAYQVVPYECLCFVSPRSINARAPGDHPKKTAFFTTGAEAVENAIKIARAATGRRGVIAFTRRLPRPHADGHGADRQGRAVQDRLRPVPGRRVPRAVPESRCTACQRRGFAARDRAPVQGRHRSEARRRDHLRAGAGRRRLLCRRRPSSCARCASSATSTASC